VLRRLVVLLLRLGRFPPPLLPSSLPSQDRGLQQSHLLLRLLEQICCQCGPGQFLARPVPSLAHSTKHAAPNSQSTHPPTRASGPSTHQSSAFISPPPPPPLLPHFAHSSPLYSTSLPPHLTSPLPPFLRLQDHNDYRRAACVHASLRVVNPTNATASGGL